MTLDPESRAAVIERAAELIAQQITQAAGGIDELVILDLSTVAQCLGVTRKWAGECLPTAQIGKSRGVSIANLRRHIERQTTRPQ